MAFLCTLYVALSIFIGGKLGVIGTIFNALFFHIIR
jgi:hypothetical protein